MPAPPPDARTSLAEVLRVARCGDDGVVLTLRSELAYGELCASRFFMLRREDGLSPLVPRPFSFYRQRRVPGGDELDFLIKVMGRGTSALAALAAGARVRLTGPLGNGWPALDADGEPWVMLAGGVGSAPFWAAIEQARAGMDGRRPCQPQQLAFLFGAARRGLLYDLDGFRGLGVRVFTATDDGSHGRRGNVVELLEALWASGELPPAVRLLACGPERMLHAVAELAERRRLACWLSLETYMGCGVGICNACPVRTRPGGTLGDWPNAKCCVEGPVFAAADVSLADR
jgi:dihydroorotate dehydrogenase electron transfer subunit